MLVVIYNPGYAYLNNAMKVVGTLGGSDHVILEFKLLGKGKAVHRMGKLLEVLLSTDCAGISVEKINRLCSVVSS